MEIGELLDQWLGTAAPDVFTHGDARKAIQILRKDALEEKERVALSLALAARVAGGWLQRTNLQGPSKQRNFYNIRLRPGRIEQIVESTPDVQIATQVVDIPKHTEFLAALLRALYSLGVRPGWLPGEVLLRELASMFGVSQSVVKTWWTTHSWVCHELVVLGYLGKPSGTAGLTVTLLFCHESKDAARKGDSLCLEWARNIRRRANLASKTNTQ